MKFVSVLFLAILAVAACSQEPTESAAPTTTEAPPVATTEELVRDLPDIDTEAPTAPDEDLVEASTDSELGAEPTPDSRADIEGLDGLREPTLIPAGWDRYLAARLGNFDESSGGELRYGPVDLTITRNDSEAEFPVLQDIEDNPSHEVIDIVGEGDGRVVTRESGGEHRLGFVDGSWSYDFLADPEADRDDLIAFARSFQTRDFDAVRQVLAPIGVVSKGNDLLVALPALVRCEAEEPEIVAEESTDSISVSASVTLTHAPDDPPFATYCVVTATVDLTTVALDRPLAARTVLSNGEQIVTAAVEDIREPTFIPRGWGPSQVDESNFDVATGGRIMFGQVLLTVARTGVGASTFERFDGRTDGEIIDVLGSGDGRLFTLNEGHLLGFVDGDWSYELNSNRPVFGETAVTPSQLIGFARSFKTGPLDTVRHVRKTEAISIEGDDVLVHITEFAPRSPNQCHAARHEVLFETSLDSVTATAVSVIPRDAEDLPFSVLCEATNSVLIQRATPDEPIGDRSVLSNETEFFAASTDIFREPTIIPAGWDLSESTGFNNLTESRQQFGPVQVDIFRTDSRAFTVTELITTRPGAEAVAGLAGGEGQIVRKTSGKHRLGFVDGGWSYDLLADETVDRDDLIAFARSFEPRGG